MTTKGKKLKLALRGAGYTQEEAANKLEISRQTLSNYLKMAEFPDVLLQNVKARLGIDLLSEGDQAFETAKKNPAIALGELKIEGNESPYIDMGNGQFLMVVPLIPIRASAGYREHFQDESYIDSHYDKHYFPVTRQYRGKYFAFVVDGDSMENWTSEEMARQSISEGATVTGRDIPKQHWVNKFHLKSFQDYVIVHKDTILVKRIINHDTINGIITCNSLNPDKIRHPDFDLDLNDCLQILNIVNVTQAR
ncbi:hypothetical protein J3L18_23035 [Mucilaginibacter gossypii]|uniref:LexA family transcriptional regulator n=1 Tax=Mucilaginibacter gossypii TaxID=551996 RepID=UPI00101A6390|nr:MULTISPECIES: XRE family transcriptional regulator [Mucilaginibacter]QTE35991.1 hypothetical protein J3L18_23035 [Mucilaginibacter gossypii]